MFREDSTIRKGREIEGLREPAEAGEGRQTAQAVGQIDDPFTMTRLDMTRHASLLDTPAPSLPIDDSTLLKDCSTIIQLYTSFRSIPQLVRMHFNPDRNLYCYRHVRSSSLTCSSMGIKFPRHSLLQLLRPASSPPPPVHTPSPTGWGQPPACSSSRQVS